MAPMKYFYELTVSSSPHAHGNFTTRRIMLDVILALCPALVGAICFFDGDGPVRGRLRIL